MRARTAVLFLLVGCIAIAVLLIVGMLSAVISAVLFAVLLVLLGVSSRGFRRPRT
jgi:hypothetical protein